MRSDIPVKVQKEELLVAELEQLGISYLSRISEFKAVACRDGAQMLADLVRQPSSRVRTALIALLISHPGYAAFVPNALRKIRSQNRLNFMLFYTAAMVLQRQHALELQKMQGAVFQWLPDLFSRELGVRSDVSQGDCLMELGKRQQELTGANVNWSGTYINVYQKMMKRGFGKSSCDPSL